MIIGKAENMIDADYRISDAQKRKRHTLANRLAGVKEKLQDRIRHREGSSHK